jgi:hypothetical protein
MGSFLLGFGAGLVGGLLMAPRPGSHYRGILSDKAGEGLNYVKDKTAGLRNSATDAMEKGKEVVSQRIENLAIKTCEPAVYQR